MENALLQEIVVIFGLSIAVLLTCHRLNIPSIVGFLVTGLICGPHGLGLVGATADVQTMADIGVVLLLFAVGLDFSIKRLLEHQRFLLVGGALQVTLTTIIGIFIGKVLGKPTGEALFLGFLLSLSSTAIVLRALENRQEVTTPHGKVSLGILIFQDIAAVPMVLLTPYLASGAENLNERLLVFFVESIVVLAAVFYLAIKLVPQLLLLVARTRSRELFLLAVLTICFSVAWITAQLGLSLPLGAFLAGLIVSESDYRNEAVEDILPFQDVFISFFFISIGMLLDLQFVLDHLIIVMLISIGVMVMKTGVAGFVTLATGMPLRTAVIVGITLSQVGEFSFVLSRAGMKAGLAIDYNYQLFLSVAILSMALTPLLMRIAPRFGDLAMRLPLPEKLIQGFHPIKEEIGKPKEDHIVIIGFGLPGQILASACAEAKIPYTAVDIDGVKVRREIERGQPIYFGDATHAGVLRHAGVAKARAVAVLINDYLAAVRTIEQVRRLNSDVYIIARTRRMDEMEGLMLLGADDVIPDEFGASIQVFTRLLRMSNVNPDEIMRIVAEKQFEEFRLVRPLYQESTTLMSVAELGVGTIRVDTGSKLIGKTLDQTRIKEGYHVNPVMVRRGEKTLMQLDENVRLQAGDIIVVVGPQDNLKTVSRELSS